MATEQEDLNRPTRDEGGAADLVEAFKNLLGVGDGDRATGDEGAPDELDSVSSGVEAGGTAQAGIDVGADVDGEVHGSVDAGGATVGGGVEGSLDTGLGGYDGSAEGEVSIDPVDGSVDAGGEVSIGQEDPLTGRSEVSVEADVGFGPTSFEAGAGTSLSYTDPFGIDTQTAGASGSYHHEIDGNGVEAGAEVEADIGDYHGEAEGNLGFGQGALDVDGAGSLSHSAPFGVATETFEGEGRAHVDTSGWEAEGEVGYEFDVGGGAPEIDVGAGVSTSGEWSDVEDAADDAGDAAQDAYDSAEGTANDAGDSAQGAYDSAEDEVNDWI